MVLNILFLTLFIHLFTKIEWRDRLVAKPLRDWILDCTGLVIQGTLIPILQTYVFFAMLVSVFPSYNGVLDWHWTFSFLFHFLFVDYLYYWNHRFFHHKALWPIHMVHHSAKDMDVMATSRNSIYTSFFLVYIWVNTIMIFLLKDPAPYLLSIVVTAGLDIWKHSKLGISHPQLMSFISRYLFIMTPQDHAWHHGKKPQVNYGANTNLFDKLHQTYLETSHYPEKIGIKTGLTLTQELFNPFKKGIEK